MITEIATAFRSVVRANTDESHDKYLGNSEKGE